MLYDVRTHLNIRHNFGLGKWGVKLKGFRNNGPSEQWAFGTMGLRNKGLSEQWAVGTMGRPPYQATRPKSPPATYTYL